jgi:hypothetical protein
MGIQPERESSLFIYHEEIAKQLSVIFGYNQTGQEMNIKDARRLVVSNIVYARSIVEDAPRDKNDMPIISKWLDNLNNEQDIYKLIAEMVFWQKQAKLTPQIVSMFGTSYFSKMKKCGAME